MEYAQASRWWSRMVPIDVADMRQAIADRAMPSAAMPSAANDARKIHSYRMACQRIRRNLPECLDTFKLICQNGSNRKESICMIAQKMQRG